MVTIAMYVLIPIIWLAILLMLASLGWWFMKPVQGATTFIVKGDSLKEIVPNIEGYRLSKETDPSGYQWIIPATNEEERVDSLFQNARWWNEWTVWPRKLLWKQFGIWFISPFWSYIHVHSFDLRRGGRRRPASRNELEKILGKPASEIPLSARVIDSPGSTVVEDLLFLVPRPIYVEGIELPGDNSKLNLFLLVIFQQVIPSLPVFNLKGDFFTSLDASVEAALVDFFATHKVAVYKDGDKKGRFAADDYDPIVNVEHDAAPLTYELWLELTKAGEGSPIELALRHLNISPEYLALLRPGSELRTFAEKELMREVKGDTPSPSTQAVSGMISTGIVPRFGFAVVSFRVVEWEPHESTRGLAASLLAKETERHTAEGVRERAYGDRDAKLANATGDSARIDQMLTSLVSKEVDPNVAAQTLETIFRTENISKMPGLATYVEGDRGSDTGREKTRTSLLLPTQSPNRKEGK